MHDELKGTVKGRLFYLEKLRLLRLAWPEETLVATAMTRVTIFHFVSLELSDPPDPSIPYEMATELSARASSSDKQK